MELVENELIRIENDPELKHLLGYNEEEPGQAQNSVITVCFPRHITAIP